MATAFGSADGPYYYVTQLLISAFTYFVYFIYSPLFLFLCFLFSCSCKTQRTLPSCCARSAYSRRVAIGVKCPARRLRSRQFPVMRTWLLWVSERETETHTERECEREWERERTHSKINCSAWTKRWKVICFFVQAAQLSTALLAGTHTYKIFRIYLVYAPALFFAAIYKFSSMKPVPAKKRAHNEKQIKTRVKWEIKVK